jgi:hypothetical protein
MVECLETVVVVIKVRLDVLKVTKKVEKARVFDVVMRLVNQKYLWRGWRGRGGTRKWWFDLWKHQAKKELLW